MSKMISQDTCLGLCLFLSKRSTEAQTERRSVRLKNDAFPIVGEEIFEKFMSCLLIDDR